MVRKTSLFLCLVALLCYLLSLLAKRNSQSSTMLELIKDQSVWIFTFLTRVKSKKRRNNINPFVVCFFCKKLKFIYSEKATKVCEIFPLLLTVCTVVKSKGKISQNFVAFSEYMNFMILSLTLLYTKSIKRK